MRLEKLGLPLHDAAVDAVEEMAAYSLAGFPGSMLEEVFAMTSLEPENSAASARLRAERNVELILAGCWEIRDELNAAGVAPEYRMAVYKGRLGVRKGKQAFDLMEATQ